MDHMSGDVRKKIEDFKIRYPGCIWGPAHIVFDDENISNGHLEFCIRECDEWFMNLRGDPYEISDTRIFLQELLAIPEDER